MPPIIFESISKKTLCLVKNSPKTKIKIANNLVENFELYASIKLLFINQNKTKNQKLSNIFILLFITYFLYTTG